MNPGTRIGPYEIVAWLGAGGMGEVYRARDSRLGRDVAIKLIATTVAADANRVHRFEQEARAAGQLNHPNILVVYDTGVHDGAPYIVSELLEGESVRSRLATGALAAPKAIDYARQTAEGLAAAHDKGIVHRDVKPDNLFITKDGRIKILDFGIAKLAAPVDEGPRGTGVPTDTAAGTVVGTVGYMSPEQVRGEAVDARSDIFSLGTVLYEMLTGRPPFRRATAAESMTAILKEEPGEPLPAGVAPGLARIISRCLEKGREARFQSARDLAFGLEVLSGTQPTATSGAPAPRRWRTALGLAVVTISIAIAAASWWTRTPEPPTDSPLGKATISRFTDFPGTESGAEISPDGKFVAFIADRDGEFDLFICQVGTRNFVNLTRDLPPLRPTGSALRSFGFTGDGSEIWLSVSGDPGGKKLVIPILPGGASRAFLTDGDTAPAWSPDGARVVYFKNRDGDPVYVADGRTIADPTAILVDVEGDHNHNPVWSPDGEWIYLVRGTQFTVDTDVWRIRPAGGQPEQLTDQDTPVNFLAPLNARTMLYVSRDKDGSGPWLWALDLSSRSVRRISSGLEQYTYVSASRDGRRVIATVANPTASLWRVPLLDRQAEERDVTPYPVQADRALAPRFAGTSLFFLSARGTGDGLWRLDGGQLSQVWNGADGALLEAPAVSPDGKRVAVLVRREGKRQLMTLSVDGTNLRTLAASLVIQGSAGQASVDWSPDGTWIAAGGSDAQGPALFKIPADGSEPVALVRGTAESPVLSPDGRMILYAGAFVGGQADLLAARPDGTPVVLPPVQVRPGGYRFLPGGTSIVYLPARDSMGFWRLDLRTGARRQLTRLANQGALSTFDITPDGKFLVFDRSRDNSDIFQIDLAR